MSGGLDFSVHRLLISNCPFQEVVFELDRQYYFSALIATSLTLYIDKILC